MTRFLNFSTRTKLFLGFGLMTLFLLAVFITAYSGITTVRQSQAQLFEEDFTAATQLIQFRSDQNLIRAQILEMMLANDATKQHAIETEIAALKKRIDDELARVAEVLKPHPEDSAKLQELLSAIAEYRAGRDQQIALIYGGHIAEAQNMGVTIQEERFKKISTLADDLNDRVIARAEGRIARSEREANTLIYVFIGIAALALLVSLGATALLSSIIAKPLGEITSSAKRIATGDLSVAPRPTERRDEVGGLTNAFATMTLYLQDTAAVSKQVAAGDLTVAVKPVSERDELGIAFANMVASLRRVNQEIRDGVNVLASSTSEILSSTTQVAAGVTETTTAVSQTTATVEEVKQTAQLAVEKSRSVSEGAQKAVLVAQQGSDAVERTLEGITHIRGLMESVAESIVRLSEQTLAIGEIITSVSDLAQQSNLLAVNAAIEASKAGEHGRGFTVVAQEIRALADQSKQATEQVRDILNDIQKATSAAVMAAEQVSKAVDSGVRQANESGEAIRRLEESIGDSADAATQIAASSQQQFIGIDQISLAMESIKQAAEQNVAGTKQTEQAAHSLNELGQRLREIVAKFKV